MIHVQEIKHKNVEEFERMITNMFNCFNIDDLIVNKDSDMDITLYEIEVDTGEQIGAIECLAFDIENEQVELFDYSNYSF